MISVTKPKKKLKYELYNKTVFLTDTYKEVLQQMQTEKNMQITRVCKKLPCNYMWPDRSLLMGRSIRPTVSQYDQQHFAKQNNDTLVF